jgi:iron complex transport system substrate-binding protein
MRSLLLWAALTLALLSPARAADIADATGRTVPLPDGITKVIPAGPPAAALLVALAPDVMIGWPHTPSAETLSELPPPVRALPQLPSLNDTEAVRALKPDLILDYGTVDPGYIQAAIKLQAATGTPSILLDGRLDAIPATLRSLGHALHRDARAEALASMAEAVLLASPPHATGSIVVIRGATGDQALVPGGGNSELIERLGFKMLAPATPGRSFRKVTPAEVAALNPDTILFLDPAMRAVVAAHSQWRSLRAVQQHHAWAVPSEPFGWVEGPPSINRLIGLAWLHNGTPSADILPMAALFHTAFYGVPPTPAEIAGWTAAIQPIAP